MTSEHDLETDRVYLERKRRALALLREGLDFQWQRPASRDELYDRARLREADQTRGKSRGA